RATGSRRRLLAWSSIRKRHNLTALPGGIWGGHGWGNLDWPSGLKKIDVTPGCYYTSAYAGEDRWLEKPPTADKPVVWQRVRKTVQHDPLGNKAAPT
ncbi:hypothetical protein, partial [Limnohabitans sp. G3-2]|uniref:hypothetical protein n=1 Tax=Limnohabitans sp. G3-2 TaxID=1100711 RepID=UPI001E62DA98